MRSIVVVPVFGLERLPSFRDARTKCAAPHAARSAC
jgi:hypothetical protein